MQEAGNKADIQPYHRQIALQNHPNENETCDLSVVKQTTNITCMFHAEISGQRH